jgi:DNA-directed RNA polymerase subunit M/transcription elongation factor TFIIS
MKPFKCPSCLNIIEPEEIIKKGNKRICGICGNEIKKRIP